jgi:hypothetical protein
MKNLQMATEQSLIEARIRAGEARILDQREQIADMATAGVDTSCAINLLSAMETSQALRRRRLAALA